MKAIIQDDPCSFSQKVWLFDDAPDGRVIYDLNAQLRETVQAGATEIEPSFTIPDNVLSALVEAASEVLPPSSAQAKHLGDAMRVRDRLLSVIEQSAGART